MITAILAFAARWWKAAAGAAVMFPFAFLLGQCSGAENAKAKQKAADAIATVEVLKTDGRAKETASGERLTDAQEVAELKKDLTDAVQDLPDELPSVRRVALGCARLRNQGIDTSSLPACSGPEGKGQAPVGR